MEISDLVAKGPESLASKLALQHSLFEMTGKPFYLDSMLKLLKDASPELKHGPYTGTEGLSAFFCFDEPLTEEMSVKLVDELKLVIPRQYSLKSDLIRAIHEVLCSKDDNQKKLGDKLSKGAVGFFLSVCHETIKPLPVLQPGAIMEEVKFALMTAEISSDFPSATPNPAQFPVLDDSVANEEQDEHEKELRGFHGILTSFRARLHELDQYICRCRKSLIENHETMLEHTSIQEIEGKIGECLDVATLRTLMDQMGSVNASIYATIIQRRSEELRAMIKDLDEVLYVVEKDWKSTHGLLFSLAR